MSAFRTALSTLAVFLLSTAIDLPAQTFTTIHSFGQAHEGSNPYANLVQGLDGNFYGTTYYGGDYGAGTIFRITPEGMLTTLFNFDGTDNGADPYCTLELGTDGNLYGTTVGGGTYSLGTVFKYSLAAGELTTLHSFDGTGGNDVFGGLVRGDDGNFYGTAANGGAYGTGVAFTITPGGRFKVLYNFKPGDRGAYFPAARLIQATDGNLYGTSTYGGSASQGAIFKISTRGAFTFLYGFCESDPSCPDGEEPEGLVQGTDGSLYGVAPSGGDENSPCDPYSGCGTLFTLAGGSGFSVVHTFDFTDGEKSNSPPYQATDGNFYGTALSGGTSGKGVLYSLAPDGSYTVIYDFCSANSQCPDGALPLGSVIQGTDGNLYGATAEDGAFHSGGTIYRVSLGLPPFIKTMPTLGATGDPVKILGNNLTGTTNVAFNGISTTFTVVSDTLIKTTVPAGATTGSVQVTTPTGTLTSNVVFRVRP
jgi:uncharacterized repeat protein (TIGR03803 family)